MTIIFTDWDLSKNGLRRYKENEEIKFDSFRYPLIFIRRAKKIIFKREDGSEIILKDRD